MKYAEICAALASSFSDTEFTSAEKISESEVMFHSIPNIRFVVHIRLSVAFHGV